MTGQDKPSSSLQSWLIAGFVVVAIIVVLRDSFSTMVKLWVEIEHFNHCFLIAPASVWLAWRQRHVLSSMTTSPSVAGLAAVALVAGFWALGSIANLAVVQDFAAVGLVPLSIWTVLGARFTRTILFPLGFLFFLVPFGEFLIPPLMNFTADMTVAAVRLSGVAVYRDGLYFAIPNGSFKIIEACSGIRMLMAGVAVGAFFAYLSFRSLRRRLLFMIGVVALTIVANWFRAYIVVMGAHFSGMDLVVDHIWLGYVVFGLVIVIMLSIGSRFADEEADGENDVDRTAELRLSVAQGGSGTAIVIACAIIAIVASAPILASTLSRLAAQPINLPVKILPVESEVWTGPRPVLDDWSPGFLGDTMTQAGRFLDSPGAVDMYVVSYRSLSRQSEMINEANRIFDSRRWTLIGNSVGAAKSATGEPIAYIETEIVGQRGSRRLVRHWYVVDGRRYTSRAAVKLVELRNTLSGRPTPAGVIAISALFDGETRDAVRVLDRFIEEMIR